MILFFVKKQIHWKAVWVPVPGTPLEWFPAWFDHLFIKGGAWYCLCPHRGEKDKKSGEGGASASFPGDNTKYSKHSARGAGWGADEGARKQDCPVAGEVAAGQSKGHQPPPTPAAPCLVTLSSSLPGPLFLGGKMREI